MLKIVTIGGASKGVGKTSLAVSIIERSRGIAAIKYSLDSPGKGVGIITDPEVLARPGTDTAKFLLAGANPVFWVLADEKTLGLYLKRVLSLLPPESKVLIEGNSVLRYLRPAFSIFIMNSSWEKIKPTGLEAIGRADAVVEYNNNGDIRERISDLNPHARLLGFNPGKPEGQDFGLLLQDLEEIWRSDMEKKVLDAVREAAKRDRIACHHARKIAEELKVPYRLVGQAADELKVKIIQCELGCF